jgi:hypothetical protein
LFGGDVQALQLASLLNELCDEITTRNRWQELLKRKTSWSALGAEDQGTLASIFGTALQNIIACTIWNQTQNEYITGALPVADWQAIQVSSIAGASFPQFTVFDGHLYIDPAPTAGDALTAFYRVRTWAADSGGTVKSAVTADDDMVSFPDELVKVGLRYKWRQEKGLPYAELMRSFEMMLADLIAGNSVAGTISMAGGPEDVRPGVWVPTDAPVS